MHSRHEEIHLDTPYRIRLSNSNISETNNTHFVSSHWHEYIEIIYVISGELEINISDENYYCYEGDLCIINSCEAHTTKFYDKPLTKFYVIQFDPSILNMSNIMYQMKYVLPFIKSTTHQKKYFPKKDLSVTNIPAIIDTLFYEFSSKDYAHELAIQSKIIDLFLFIIRSWNKQNQMTNDTFTNNPDDIKFMKTAMDYANNHFKEPITVKEASKQCNLTYTYFSSKFKKSCGQTFKQYLEYIRLKEAEKLLVTTSLSITDIAYQTGFGDTSYFIHVFKKSKLKSPNKFRKQFSK